MREQRKVTVLCCDLVGSTALGESTDPEALRAPHAALLRGPAFHPRALRRKRREDCRRRGRHGVLAEALVRVDRVDEAVRAVERAIALHEQKGNVVSATRSRAVLEDLRAARPS